MSKLSKEERIKYDRALKRYRDMYNTITGAEAKGEAKGRAEERMAIACKLKAIGMSVADIVNATGLTAEEIAAL